MKRSLGSTLVIVTLALALPAGASAHDTYVNQGTGANTGNDCSDSANPCRTLARGLSQAGPGDTVFVAGGYTYTTSIDLGNGKSLVHDNFGGASGDAILDNSSAAEPDVTVSSTAGKIKGFTIRSVNLPVLLNAGVLIQSDVFDTGAAVPEAIHVSSADSESVVITKCTFEDPTPLTDFSAQQKGISDIAPASVTIKKSKFKDLFEPIYVDEPGADVVIENNKFLRSHGLDHYIGASIAVLAAQHADILENKLKPSASTAGEDGIVALRTDAFVYRNFVSGYRVGIAVGDSDANATVADDVVIEPDDDSAVGVGVSDYDNPDPDARDATLSHLTLWGPGEAVDLQKAQVKIDSSILGGKGVKTFYANNSCDISHTRGPHKKHTSNGCKDVQTTANPKLKSDDYHLKGKSSMIDSGRKGSLFHFEKDIDGDKRKLAGDCSAKHPKKRTDIGADEYRCPKR